MHSIALKFKGRGMAYEDLCQVRRRGYLPSSWHSLRQLWVQEGVGGLLRGAQKFDPSRSAKLSTYCYLWILRVSEG